MIKNNKGFTLVELIVTLLILAILAAILVPTLLGYINKSKTSSLLEETNQIRVAAQAMYDQAYGKNKINFGSSTNYTNRGAIAFSNVYPYKDYTTALKKLAAMKSGTCCCIKYAGNSSTSGIGSVEAIQYFDGQNGCTFYDAKYYTDADEGPEWYPVPSKELISTYNWEKSNTGLEKSNNSTKQIYIFA
ncbi:MAG: prepilin-type N-terminal cleavage/methylation domain-containing protein [Lachnospiraceae bacterium]|jgi:prepilin-type N-terminal cleavage/methylation domain-containing protein|nr:prepilin-type N-terminal cleavage/methylation domain-containing protein [Lachnospiraceae bacterium]